MKITFLGGGNMASALIGGLLKQGFAASEIQAIELLEAGRERLAQSFAIRCFATAEDAALNCDVLVLAVKPQHMREALLPIAGRLHAQLVVSIAAGSRLQDLTRWLGGHRRLVRAMPNTPALIGQGITGLYADDCVSTADRETVDRILKSAGTSVWVENEALLEAVTALSGSGPAYVFHFIETLQAGGEALGLPADTARTLAIQTLLGSSMLAAQSEDSPAVLRERVTSKGGTTAAALTSLAADDFPAIVARALKAAAARGKEMGEMLGQDPT